MYILHVALQGCLSAGPIDYGLTADTGGHIRYLLDLVKHAGEQPGVTRQEVVTRAFEEPGLGPRYMVPRERLGPDTDIVRLASATPGYLAKEDLWREHESLADALTAYIRSRPQRPDVLHAHYADGGEVARRVARATGIPYVFTAHSLGRVKAIATGAAHEARIVPGGGDELSRRIRTEEVVIAEAARIVASSRDEAEYQYGLYAAADPARITVNPPGSYLCADDSFALPGATRPVRDDLARFLADPDKPAILALARPVRKKNLTGLIEAYAASPALQEAANLVIYAGTRGVLEEQEPENRAVLEELLALIERHDLYGRVALPKVHTPDEVPSLYAYAAGVRGVFANPALNEPFGLTILEAAAAGLPVVATNSGGPVDIVGRCENGVLVDPRDADDIAAGALALLTDPARWDACAEAGRRACDYYDWSRHASDYAAMCRQLARPARVPVAMRRPRPFLIASDIDDTLTGDKAALRAFARWHGADTRHHFSIATGRSLHGAIEVLREWGAPVPDVMITSVGTEIYFAREHDWDLVSDTRWSDWIDAGWDPVRIHAEVMDFGAEAGVIPQGAREQRRHKVSFFCPDDDAWVRSLRRHLASRGLRANVVHSHAKFLDVLPVRASKGHALRYLAQRLALPMARTIAAGDSGNDVELLRAAAHPIVVANHTRELSRIAAEARTFLAARPFAGGLLDGIRAFHADRPGVPVPLTDDAKGFHVADSADRHDHRTAPLHG